MRKLIIKLSIFIAIFLFCSNVFAQQSFPDQITWGGISSGTANAQIISVPNLSALPSGGVDFRFMPSIPNTSATTLKINALPAYPILKQTPTGLTALTGGELALSTVINVIWDGTQFELIGQGNNPADVPHVSTAAALQALIPTQQFSVIRDYCINPGDAPPQYYIWNPTGNAAADGSGGAGSIVVPTGHTLPGEWVAQFNTKVPFQTWCPVSGVNAGTGSITAGSNVFTCSGCTFTSNNVGQTIIIGIPSGATTTAGTTQTNNGGAAELTVASAAAFNNGDWVTIVGTSGTTGQILDGFYPTSKQDSTHITLIGSTYTGTVVQPTNVIVQHSTIVGTILSINSSSSVTLSTTASTTVSSALWESGMDSTAKAEAWWTYLENCTFCDGDMGEGRYMIGNATAGNPATKNVRSSNNTGVGAASWGGHGNISSWIPLPTTYAMGNGWVIQRNNLTGFHIHNFAVTSFGPPAFAWGCVDFGFYNSAGPSLDNSAYNIECQGSTTYRGMSFNEWNDSSIYFLYSSVAYHTGSSINLLCNGGACNANDVNSTEGVIEVGGQNAGINGGFAVDGISLDDGNGSFTTLTNMQIFQNATTGNVFYSPTDVYSGPGVLMVNGGIAGTANVGSLFAGYWGTAAIFNGTSVGAANMYGTMLPTTQSYPFLATFNGGGFVGNVNTTAYYQACFGSGARINGASSANYTLCSSANYIGSTSSSALDGTTIGGYINGNKAASVSIQASTAGTPNASNATITVLKDSVTGRSVNVAGTVNINGADFAEWERVSPGIDSANLKKGQIIGFDKDGNVTTSCKSSLSFGIVSTNPGSVGGDTFSVEDQAHHAVMVGYSGKLPVNVTGANAGQIITAACDGDAIVGHARGAWAAWYETKIGYVRSILPDGRARVAVGGL